MRNWSEPESTAHDGIGLHACTFARQEGPRDSFSQDGFFDEGTMVVFLSGWYARGFDPRTPLVPHRGARQQRTDAACGEPQAVIGPGIRTILKNLEAALTEAELDGMERLVTRRGLTFLQAGQKHLPDLSDLSGCRARQVGTKNGRFGKALTELP
jgi:hypothetical protein